ncbi:MAG: DUF3800 domain-containing protein [Gemmatimonadota bacterium]
MYLCYVDESGDSGYAAQGSPSTAFVLSAVLLQHTEWADLLDRLKTMRGYFHQKFGVSRRVELKANYLIHRKGPFKTMGLSPTERLKIYEYVMRMQEKETRFTTFAVLIDKGKINKPQSVDPRAQAWKLLIERIDNFTGTDENVMLFPDAGHGYFIQRMVRRMRRHHRVESAFEPGTFLEADALRLVEDPSDRVSHDSYFIQLADLNAYAALRTVHPSTNMDGRYWEMLGERRLEAVNRIRGGPVGIKVFPT